MVADVHRTLKYGGIFIVDAVADLTRDTLFNGYIPEILKPVWVTPIWKGVDREEAVNYRPISITNHILKVIERVVRQQMADFLSHNKRILDDQGVVSLPSLNSLTNMISCWTIY